MKKKNKTPRLYDFRIEYSSEDSLMSNYHYYTCETSAQALEFQREMINHKGWEIKLISIQKKNPYNDKWEDRSELLNEESEAVDEIQ